MTWLGYRKQEKCPANILQETGLGTFPF